MGEPDAAQPSRPSDDEILVPLDALEAAWNEVEAVQAEGSSDAADADAPAAAPIEPASAASEASSEEGVDEAASAPAPPPDQSVRKGMRFIVGKKKAAADRSATDGGTDEVPAAASSDAEPESEKTSGAAEAPDARITSKARDARREPRPTDRSPAPDRMPQPRPFMPRVPWWKRLLRAVDDLLDVVNRPFGGLSPQVRSLIGVASLTTIIVSLTSAWLIPTLFPHRDAITFLEEARARVLSQASRSAGPTGEQAERPAPSAEQG